MNDVMIRRNAELAERVADLEQSITVLRRKCRSLEAAAHSLTDNMRAECDRHYQIGVKDGRAKEKRAYRNRGKVQHD